MTNIDSTLKERGSTYGNFLDQSTIAGKIKDIMMATPKWNSLDYDMKEAFDMIAVKIARMLNGDPWHIDSWHDIIGYSRLVEKRLTKEQEEKEKDAANQYEIVWTFPNYTTGKTAAIDPQVFTNCQFAANRTPDPLVERGLPYVQEDLFPTNDRYPIFRGWDGQYEHWEFEDGRVDRYYPEGDRVCEESTVSGLFSGGGKPFNPLYDLTQGNSCGTIPVATGDGDS